ncbi:MAG TPA: glycosyltransferase family 4 protein [Xanthobacteraceae bacterium]|nr:glycosyltransferase family 4 protein [Xanthobacteraceae bacterium]
MSLTVLNVAYPFAPVGAASVGGAEQVLSALDAALVRAGHRSIVIACKGSRTADTLLDVPRVSGTLNDRPMTAARARHSRTIKAALDFWPIDVVHLHGIDFASYLPPVGVPTLATLHLPIDWYTAEALNPTRPDTWLNCVSATQHAACRGHPRVLAPIENGVALNSFRAQRAKGRFALMLARICPEKGVHLAIEAAKRADIPLLIAGQVFPYESHQRYFRREVAPRLDRWRRFIGIAGPQRKRRLLAEARCLLVPSLAPETSSLVAREAIASGTPVIAFARGALVETIEHGRTGFLVQDEIGMAQAIGQISKIDPKICRKCASARFSLEQMTARYFALYESLRCRRQPGV